MINIGIDVHKKMCVATIKGNGKDIIEQTEFKNSKKDIEAFAAHVKKTHGKNARAVCEATGNYWMILHDTLEDCGIDTILAHPAKTKAIAEAKLKDDRVDSEVLADLLLLDMVYESFVPDERYRNLRNLARTRLDRVRTATEQKNKITALLAKYEHKLPTKTKFSKTNLKWMRTVSVSPVDRLSLDSYLDTLQLMQKQTETLEREIASECMDDDRAKLVMTVTGIGYVTALTIIAEIVDVKRFRTAEKLVSYAGLSPSHRNSGETKRGGGITKKGSVWLRNAMVEAANVAARYDARMSSTYERLSKRIGKKKAKVAIARRLTEVVWHILTDMAEYRTQDKDLVQRKYKAAAAKARPPD